MTVTQLSEYTSAVGPSGLSEPCAVVRLEAGEVWTRRMRRGDALQVICLNGLVWATREGDYQDHFLRTADTYASHGPGLVCAEAMVPSQLLVTWDKSARRL